VTPPRPAAAPLALAAALPLVVTTSSLPLRYGDERWLGLIVVVLAFAITYRAMAERMPGPVVPAALIARGVGRPLGLGAAALTLLSGAALQLALYRAAGEVGASLLSDRFAWWQVALGCSAIVAGCSLLPARVTTWLLVLLIPAVIGSHAGGAGLGDRLGDLVAGLPLPDHVMTALILAGLIAAIVGVHQLITLQLVVLGRERMVPAVIGRAPAGVSLAQSAVAAATLGGCAYAGFAPGAFAGFAPSALAAGAEPGFAPGAEPGFAPGAELGFAPGAELGPAGGLGLVLLLTVASLAALLFLNRDPAGAGVWRRLVAPLLSTVGLGVLCYLALPGVPLVWAGVVLAGAGYGLVVRWADPVRYAGIGLGGFAVVVTPVPPALPRQRAPGAHRPNRVDH
jgi:hypothetical protein